MASWELGGDEVSDKTNTVIIIEKSDFIMKCVPIIIPTLCRYEHFKDCVESLKCCPEASQTELFVGLDYPAKEEHVPGWEKIGRYLDTLSGFRQIHVFRHTTNLGLGVNGNFVFFFEKNNCI